MRDWPKHWKAIVCRCGATIGGYNTAAPPQLIHIEHRCNPESTSYMVTELMPTPVRVR